MKTTTLRTGLRYAVKAVADGALDVEFTATLKQILFEDGGFGWLVFDNGVRLWSSHESAQLDLVPVGA